MSVRYSIAWGFLGQFVTAAVTFGGSVILARLLSPGEFGIYAIAAATVGIIQVVTAFGVSSYVVREAQLQPAMFDTAFTVNALLSMLLSALILAVSYGGAGLFGDPGAARVMRVLALIPLFNIFAFRTGVMLQREMRFRALATIGMASTIAGTGLTVVAALNGWSYMSPAVGGIAAATFALAGHLVVGRRFFSMRTSLAGSRPMILFGLQMVSIGGLAVLTAKLSDVILGSLLGLAALGLYARASGLSAAIFENVYGTVTRVLFVKMSQDFHRTGRLAPTYLRALSVLTAVMWPLVGGVGVLARPIVQLLYGERWMEAALPLSLLMIWQVVAFAFAMNWELFVLRQETGRQTKIEAIRSVVGLVTFTIGCSFGIGGAAVGRIMDVVVGMLLYLPHLRRLAGTAEGDIARTLATSGMLTAAAVTPAACLMLGNDWSEHTPLSQIMAAVLLGGCLWLALLVKMKHPLVDELRRVAIRLPVLRTLIGPSR